MQWAATFSAKSSSGRDCDIWQRWKDAANRVFEGYCNFESIEHTASNGFASTAANVGLGRWKGSLCPIKLEALERQQLTRCWHITVHFVKVGPALCQVFFKKWKAGNTVSSHVRDYSKVFDDAAVLRWNMQCFHIKNGLRDWKDWKDKLIFDKTETIPNLR